MKKTSLILTLFMLSGCAGTDWSAINQKISDTAESLTQTFKNGGMPLLTPASNGPMESTNKTYSIPVDVDTAAARLKRHYQFISAQELASLRSSANDGAWKAETIDGTHPVWDSQPGSYYKMGSDWNENDHLDIEVEKNGSGSKLFITYRSASSQRLAGKGVQTLMSDIRAVASGQR